MVLVSGKEVRASSHPGCVAQPSKGPDGWAAGRRKSQAEPAPCGPSPLQLLPRQSAPTVPLRLPHRALLNSCWVVSCWFFSLLSSPFSVCNNLGGGQQICWRRRFPGPHGFGSLCKEVREELVPLERSPLGPSLGMEVGMLVVGRDLVLLCLMLRANSFLPWVGTQEVGPQLPVPPSWALSLLCSGGGRTAGRLRALFSRGAEQGPGEGAMVKPRGVRSQG